MRCKICVNSVNNPSRKFVNGICNVCSEYKIKFSKNKLKSEMDFLTSLAKQNGSIDCIAAVSGGKDSIAMLYDIKTMGFTPLAFTFEMGYNKVSSVQRIAIENATKILKIKHEYIDGRKYMNSSDIKSLYKTADFYDTKIYTVNSDDILKMFEEERFCNSPKSLDVRAFIRPCRLCKRFVIRGYFHEAIKRDVSVVFLGINEWCGTHNSNYSAIRKLEPIHGKIVYIVHLPFLLQKTFPELRPILETLCWPEKSNIRISTGATGCFLAQIYETKIFSKLGFHPDETRLAREVTAGFISRDQALCALQKNNQTNDCPSMMEVLIRGGILNL